MQSVMQYDFGKIENIQIPRSSFDLSHGHKTTFDSGWLIPLMWMEVLPADTISVNLHHLTRLATPYNPVMDNMYFDTQAFFIPFRQISDNTRKFYGEQVNPSDSIDFAWPISSGTTDADPEGDLTTAAGRTAALLDYIGIPTGIDASDVDINSLVMRSYYHCYNEWYRDQNLQDSLVFNTGDGPDTDTDYQLQKRGKRADYFTSSLPWPQKGDAVRLPLGDSVPVTGIGTRTGIFGGGPQTVTETGGATPTYAFSEPFNSVTTLYMEGDAASGGEPQVYADLSSAVSATVNGLRESFQVQKLLERDARAGTRFPDMLKNHFGVNFYDLSYRPAYLGGGSSRINVTPVTQTSPAAAAGTTAPSSEGVGDLAGVGVSSGGNHSFTSSFNEPGIVLMLGSVRADLTYQQGLNRFLSKRTRYEMYFPTLAHLGEQEVLNKEIYCDGSANDDLAFGYQERYAEYRFMPSRLSGLFRSAASSTLDSWHLSQEFSSLPTLGDTFIKEDPPIDRVIQVATEPQFISDIYFQVKAARPLPVFGTPGLIDHF